jgi:hypothetical protein
MLSITENKGFQLTFENGWTISVQFGYGNYCKNNHHPDGPDFSNRERIVSSSDAEIAIWDKEGNWYNFGTDTVKGWCSPNEVAEWIEKITKWSDESKYIERNEEGDELVISCIGCGNDVNTVNAKGYCKSC